MLLACFSEAKLAYAGKDYNSSYIYATQSQSTLNDLISQVSALTENANNSDNQNFIISVLSVIGSLAILCLGVVAWFAISRRDRQDFHGSV